MGNLSKKSGIYAIVNIMDSKVYVGQAKEFNNRDHFLQLKKGNDTKRLQMLIMIVRKNWFISFWEI